MKNLKTAVARASERAHNPASMGLTVLKEQVDEAVGRGADLHEVEEDVIEHAPVEPEVRDALWLYAWSRLESDDDRPRFRRAPR